MIGQRCVGTRMGTWIPSSPGRRAGLWLTALSVLAAVGCGSGDQGSNGGGPPVVTLPPTGTLRGLAVASPELLTWDLGRGAAPPAATEALAESGLMPGSRFATAVPEASFSIEGASGVGSTAHDGTFFASGLGAADHRLRLQKTVNGNLLDATVSVHLGTDSGTALLVEMSPGGYRVTQRYLEAGRLIEQVLAPNGSTRATKDDALEAYSLPGGTTFEDRNGDGTVDDCTETPAEAVPSVPPSVPDEPPPAGAPEPPIPEPPAPCGIGAIERIEVTTYAASGRLVVGQTIYLAATGFDRAGHAQDVTSITTWSSSNPVVADVDGWGALTGRQAGSIRVNARLGKVISPDLELKVVPRPPLETLYVQNLDCFYLPVAGEPKPALASGEESGSPPSSGGGSGGSSGSGGAPVPIGDLFYPPTCTGVVEIGGERHYSATGKFGDEYYQDVTAEVRWTVDPESVGSIGPDGTLHAIAAGSAGIRAELAGVTSDTTNVQVFFFTEPAATEIYTNYPAPIPLAGGVESPDPQDGQEGSDPGLVPSEPRPCAGEACIPISQTVLSGDRVQFHALGRYDTGSSTDLTDEAKWSSTAPLVGTVSSTGELVALLPGNTDVKASFGGVGSAPYRISVVGKATPVQIWTYLEGPSRIVKKGESVFLHATAAYDVSNLTREVTGDVEWQLSDPKIASVATNGELVGHQPGFLTVTARLGDLTSAPIELEVWETSNLNYCDPQRVNRAIWSDDLNRVVLETDCAGYGRGDTVTLRYTIDEIRPNPAPLIDPCLDLYVYRGDQLVRTIREEGCGAAIVPEAGAAPADATLYQTLAFWDQRDSGGAQVAPGSYRIVARFYIYYDPIVELPIEVRE